MCVIRKLCCVLASNVALASIVMQRFARAVSKNALKIVNHTLYLSAYGCHVNVWQACLHVHYHCTGPGVLHSALSFALCDDRRPTSFAHTQNQ